MHTDSPILVRHPAADFALPALRAAANTALQQLAPSRPELDPGRDAEHWLEQTVSLLAHSIASGRLARVQDASPGLALADYAAQILQGLWTDGERVEAFRKGDAATWTAIARRLERQAYRRLAPLGRGGWAADAACDLAAVTCADLWEWLQRHPFPFDVPFDRWLARGLVNRLYAGGRGRAAGRRWIEASLDEPFESTGATYGDLVSTHDMEAWLEQEIRREDVHWALGRLAGREVRIVRLWYLEGWSAAEIAAALGLPVRHVYVLRSRALARLRTLAGAT